MLGCGQRDSGFMASGLMAENFRMFEAWRASHLTGGLELKGSGSGAARCGVFSVVLWAGF